jgi:cysteine desulfurase / selenocysteine lyase
MPEDVTVISPHHHLLDKLSSCESPWRRYFPFYERVNSTIFLDSASTALKAASVIERINEYYKNGTANVFRGAYPLSERVSVDFEEVREKVAHFVGASDHEEVVFTSGTTDSVNLVAYAWLLPLLHPGDEILLTVLEHHANFVPWQLVAEKSQAIIKVIPLLPSGELDLSTLPSLLSPKTRLIAVTHISNAIGTINDIQAIRACAPDIPILVDAAQSVAYAPLSVEALQCDFLVFSGHKIFGPSGVGILWARRSFLEKFHPWKGGGAMIDTVSLTGTTFREVPYRLEAGTPPIAEVLGLGAAIDFLQALPREQVRVHKDLLRRQIEKALKAVPQVELIPAPAERAPVISFIVPGIHPHDIGSLLGEKGVCVRVGHHCCQPLMHHLGLSGTIRVSFEMYNTESEGVYFVDALIDAIQTMSN